MHTLVPLEGILGATKNLKIFIIIFMFADDPKARGNFYVIRTASLSSAQEFSMFTLCLYMTLWGVLFVNNSDISYVNIFIICCFFFVRLCVPYYYFKPSLDVGKKTTYTAICNLINPIHTLFHFGRFVLAAINCKLILLAWHPNKLRKPGYRLWQPCQNSMDNKYAKI